MRRFPENLQGNAWYFWKTMELYQFIQKKVALFGNGARATIKGGTGSGDVNTRNNVNIEQGFQNAGIEVTTTAWLDRQEQNTSAAKAAYVQWMKEEATRKQTSEFAVMFDHPYKEPD